MTVLIKKSAEPMASREIHLRRSSINSLMKFVFMVLLLATVSLAQAQSSHELSLSTTQVVKVPVRMPYLVILPKEYDQKPGPWPVLLYLHGAGDRGTDIALVRRVRAVQEALVRKDYPFILLAPQETDPDQAWISAPVRTVVMQILDEVIARYHGDSSRVYLTGISMGGWGTWFLAKQYPGRFAAIAPLCGHADTTWAPALVHTPIWTFHGTEDNVAPISETKAMVETLHGLGGNPKFTPIVGADHDIANVVYSRDDLYRWLLGHSLPSPH